MSKTKVYCNNFGYVGTARLDGLLRTFSWGASYNRVTSFDRAYSAYTARTNASLSNYIASFTSAPENDLNFGENYNPYLDSNEDWLSILAYNSFMINPKAGGGYQGLRNSGTIGDALSEVRESGYVDEYAIDFGGNIGNVVMWGIGFGITDLSFNQTTYYSESMEKATIPTETEGPNGEVIGKLQEGNAGVQLRNYRNINGNGFNLKLGVIVKPINEFRIGFAVHTPHLASPVIIVIRRC